MVLAIEADGASYRDSRSARDRDRLRKEHLERLGWTFHRIWSTNWFSDPATEVAKVQEAYHEAVTKIGPPAAGDPGATGPPPADGPGATGPAPADGPGATGPPPADGRGTATAPPGQAIAVREPARREPALREPARREPARREPARREPAL